MVVCNVILPDSHRGSKREKVKIPTPNPLFADNRCASFLVFLFNSWYNLLNEVKLPLMYTSTIYSKILPPPS